MKNIISDHRGFTIIEIIASLLIVGFIGMIVSMGMVQAVNGYVYAKQHTETLHKAQSSLSRLVKELNAATSISTADTDLLAFNSMTVLLTVYKDGDSLKLKSGTDDDVLSDNVQNFQLAYYEKHDSTVTTADVNKIKIVDIRLEIIGANNRFFIFKDRVFLRNVVN